MSHLPVPLALDLWLYTVVLPSSITVTRTRGGIFWSLTSRQHRDHRGRKDRAAELTKTGPPGTSPPDTTSTSDCLRLTRECVLRHSGDWNPPQFIGTHPLNAVPTSWTFTYVLRTKYGEQAAVAGPPHPLLCAGSRGEGQESMKSQAPL